MPKSTLLVLQLHEGAVEVHGDDLQRQAQVVGDVLGQVHLKARQLVDSPFSSMA